MSDDPPAPSIRSPRVGDRPIRSSRGLGRVRTAFAIAALGAIAVAGCSGSAASPGGSPAVGSDFATKALAACAHARELKDAEGSFPVPSFNPTKPDASKFAAVAAFLMKTDQTFRTWLSEMQALGAPPSAQSAWSSLVADIQRHVDLNAEQITAANSGDTATFAADYAKGVQTQAALLNDAIAAGVADCAKVDR